MKFVEQMTQAITIPAASSYPAAPNSNNNTVNTLVGPVSMAKFRRIMGHVMAQTIGANVTNITAQFQSSNANNGTFSNVPSGATVTLNTSNSEGTIEMRADQIPANNTWVQMLIQTTTNTNAGNNVNIAGSLFGGHGSYEPCNQFDFSTNTSLLNRQVM
jgi:hypothetical protein